MRLGEGEYKLPDYIPTRGFLLLEEQKFSKSRGWYLGLRDFLSKFPQDYLRYYLAAITPYAQTDVNFDWTDFQKRINNELIANIGNFIHRTLTFISNKYDLLIPQPQDYDGLEKEFVERIKGIPDTVGVEIERNELSKGLGKIIEFSAFCNQYFQKRQPWSDKSRAGTTLYLCVNAVRSLSILLEPYIPFSAEKLWQQLNLQGSIHEQNWTSAAELKIQGGHRINKPAVLFQRVPDEEIEKEQQKLHKAEVS
jgi:methionyl-tRNA synthetase